MERFGLTRLLAVWSARFSDSEAVSVGDVASLGFSDTDTFRRMLEDEHRRRHGSHRPLSAVAIRYRAAPPEPSVARPARSVRKRMLECVAHNLRDTDLKHFDGRAITVLLPDTSADGAAIVGQRLSDLARTSFEGVVPRGEAGEGVVFRHWPVIEVFPAPVEGSPPPAPAGTGGTRTERGDRGVAGRTPHGAPAHPGHRWSGPALAKRAIDLVGASLGVVLTLPLMGLIAAAIKLTSPGPALFRQQRVGYRGREFSMLKFRTMRVDGNDELHREYIRSLIENGARENRGTESRPVFKLTDDPRVTPLGALLRRWSLDELPQLWNVIAGDMSLVGPRPSVHYEIESYRPWYFQRLEAKPGLTGFWQVHGRARTTFDDMVRMDLRYLKRRSLLLDVKLIAGTFGAVLRRRGGL